MQKLFTSSYGTFTFHDIDLARGFASRATKSLWLVKGEGSVVYATTPANAVKMERMGYEMVW